MASFTLGEILKAVSGVLLQQGSHEYCTGVNTDTRTISPGELFIALQGNTSVSYTHLTLPTIA